VRKVSLKTIERRIEALKLQAEKLKTRNKKPAIREITRLMRKHDISVDDLRGTSGGRSARGARGGKSPLKGRRVKAMYRNPKTGESWSGRGRAARWIVAAEKAGHKRTEFLIKKG
jgi:DNA-binding protein H-NS